MKSFQLNVVTPDGLIYDGEVESLTVRTTDGDVEFLAGHIDYMASLGVGRARIIKDGKELFAAVSGGFITVKGSRADLVAITFEFAEDIDLRRAEAARDKAREALSGAHDNTAIEIAQAKLKRALTRINVANM